MNAKDAIRFNMNMSDQVIQAYIADLDDADLLIRPVDGMNHIAWQLGHLIASERRFIELIKPGASPALPQGFDEGHGREAFNENDPSKYYPRTRYQELWQAQRQATMAVLDELPESDLDQTNDAYPPFAPTTGALFNMVGLHPTMHCGQFVAVRRKLGKPVAI